MAKIKARVLSDSEFGRPNDIIEIEEAAAKAGVQSGVLDTDKAAVSYAAALPQNQRKAAEPAAE